jgi:cyclic pyranopterin phosphate synthase
MADDALVAALFSFDDADPALERMPIAARRALDLSGWRVALDAWRAMPWDSRRKVTIAGAAEIVDPFVVEEGVRKAGTSVVRVRPAPDPDSGRPPPELLSALEPGRSLDARSWSQLRALQRYALLHALRQAPDKAYLHDVFDELFPQRATSPLPPPHLRTKMMPQTNPPSTQMAPTRSHPPTISRPPPTRAATDPGSPRLSSSSYPPSAQGERAHAASIPGPPRLPSELPRPGSAPPSTHLTAAGEVHMVDVGAKAPTARKAVATASVRMRAETIAKVARHDVDKGEVLATARIAGIQAAKRTPELIPLCHHVALTRVEVHLDLDLATARIHATAVAEAYDRTGAEMEAMVAASVACLTIYDMLKGTDREMVIESVKLLEKSGGRTGTWRREGA